MHDTDPGTDGKQGGRPRAGAAAPRRNPKTGKWDFIVDIGHDPATGKRRQVRKRGYRTKAEAQAALNALRNDVQAQTYVPPARQTMAEYLDEWLEAIRATVEPSTHESYSRVVRTNVKPYIGDVQLQRLDALTLNRLYGELRQRLSVRSVRYAHAILHRALRDAVRWGRLVRNPSDASDPPRARDARAPEMRTWSASDLARFLGAEHGSRYRTAWLTLATTGMRRGELLGLRWGDVDFENGRVSIRRTVSRIAHKIVVSSGTKTGKGRAVDLDATTLSELKTHRARQGREQLLLGIRPDSETFVFCRPDGRAYDPDKFSGQFASAIDRHAGIPKIRLHDLRHTHATLALAAGVPTKVVSERLGHASMAITADTYSHVTASMGTDAAERVAALIFGAPCDQTVTTSAT